jgi:hypothetical protein
LLANTLDIRRNCRPNHRLDRLAHSMDNGSQPELDARQETLLGIAEGAYERGRFFFYVRIPGNIQPVERGERFEDPLQAALDAENLGEVSGGGSQLAGRGKGIEFCGMDVEVIDRDRGLHLIREVMRRLDAPPGTIIEEYLPTFRELSIDAPAV